MVPSARPQEYPEFDRASKAPYVSFPISQELAVCADFLAAAGLHSSCNFASWLWEVVHNDKCSEGFWETYQGFKRVSSYVQIKQHVIFSRCYWLCGCVCVCVVAAVVGSVSLPCFIDDPASAVKLLCCRSVSTCYFLSRQLFNDRQEQTSINHTHTQSGPLMWP